MSTDKRTKTIDTMVSLHDGGLFSLREIIAATWDDGAREGRKVGERDAELRLRGGQSGQLEAMARAQAGRVGG